MQIHEVLTTPRSPWENAYVGRVIGSIRRECLGHVIVLSVAWFQRVLANDVAYYEHEGRNGKLRDAGPPLQRHRVVGNELVQPCGRWADVMERFGPLDSVEPA